jgi:hypothetical protein
MATSATLEYLIKVNDRDLKELKGRIKDTNEAFDDSEKKGGKFGKALGGLAKGAMVAGAALGGGLAVAAKIGFDEFREGERVAAQTDAVLKSMGATSWTSAKHIDTLSTSLMRKSGVDDETIKSGQNLLLTFGNIRNEAGKGNDIFDQTTRTMLDMSVALGQDTSNSAIQLGKALNDPVKGVTALQRVGVSFTESQKDQIKTLVESGNTMGAQKLILKELENQFGGSAEAAGKTFGGQVKILKGELSNMAGEVVAKVMPYLLQFVQFIVREVVPWLRNFAQGLQGGSGSVTGSFGAVVNFIRDHVFPILVSLVGAFRSAISTLKQVLKEHEEDVETIVGAIKIILQGIAWVIRDIIIPLLRQLFRKGGPFALAFGLAIDIIAGVIDVVGDIAGAVRKTVEAVVAWWNKTGKPAWNTVWDAAKKPIDTIVDAVKEIVDAVKWVADALGKIKFPKMPWGGPSGGPPLAGAWPGDFPGVGPESVTPALWDELQLARSLGLTFTSGYRSSSRTKHGVYPSKAIDVSNGYNTPQMRAFALAAMRRPGIDEVFYDPLGFSMDQGRIVPFTIGGHTDHVHVGVFHKGGVVPGPRSREVPAVLTGGEGVFTPEQMAALGGGRIMVENHLYLDGEEIGYVVRDQIVRIGSRNIDSGIHR